MAKKTWNNPIDKNVDWGGDESTNYLPVSGEMIQKFIKERLTEDKYGYFRIVDDKIQFFKDEESASLYDENPDNSYLLLGEAELPSGGGSGLQYYIRTINNLESRNFAVSIGNACYVDFTFVSQMRDNSELPYEDTKERGHVQIYARARGNEYSLIREFYCDSGISVKVDVSKYLTSGENDIMVRITGEETQQAAPALTYGITLTALSINADNFQWWKGFSEDFIIPFQIGGNVNKILNVKVKGTDYEKDYEVSLGKTVYVETSYNFNVPCPENPGVYTIEAYVQNVDGTIKTKPISIDIICVPEGDSGKYVAINGVNVNLTNWSDNKVLEYSCYDGGNVSTSLVFETLKEGNSVVVMNNSNLETGVKHTLNVPLEIATMDDADFEVEQIIKDASREFYRFYASVDNSLGYSASAGASLFINPKLRSNSQSNRETFINEMDGSEVSAQWTNIGWGLDGWTQDSEGNKILKMFAGAKAVLNYKPFAIEPARSGKTIEMDLAIRNVSDYTNLAVNMSAGNVGIELYPDDIKVFSQSLKDEDTQSVNFKDDERIRMSVVLTPNAYGNSGFNLCIIYINGVKNREFTYENNDYFQNNGSLTIGCTSADVDLYGLRVYDFALTTEGVLRNLLNWEVSSEVRENISRRNDVLDANGSQVDYNKVKAMFNTFVFTGDIPSLNNPNKFNGDLIVAWVEHPEWNSTVKNSTCDGQGTSAKRYWKWNLRWKLASDTKVIYADGSETTGVWRFVPNQVPIEIATAKLNWASSMQAHKMGSVNSIADLMQELNIHNEANGRPSVYQYPFVGFSKSVNEDGEDVYTFLGLFTFGPDKGDANTFGYDEEKYPELLSLEGSDNAPLPALFRVPWNKNSGRFAYNSVEEAFQYNGVNCWDFNAGKVDNIDRWIDAYNFVYECSPRLKPFEGTLENINANVNTYKDQPYDFWLPNGDVIYYEASEGKFIYADTGNGTINLISQLVDKGYGLTSEILEGKTASQKNELFIAARIQKFRLEMSNYWDLDDAIFQRNWVEFNAATDNRAKNTYPYSLVGTFRWRSDDTDTIWPINNQGQSSKGYEVEVGDKYANGQPVWNGETSNFWNLLELAFPNEIIAGMQAFISAMETLGGKTTGTSLEKIYAFYQKYYFDMAQEYFSETLYNEAAKVLYEAAKQAYIKGTYTNDTDPITQSLGDHYSAEKRWIIKRIIYMMSKYSYGEFSANGTDSITVRASGNIINYEITPAIWMYPNIVNGTSIVRGARTQPGEVCNIEVDLGGSADQQNTIQGASYIQDIGEWYDKSVSGSMIIKGRMLSNVSLGHKTAPITIAITSLTLADVPALRTLNLSRISTLGGTLDLSECMRLEECHMDGTSLIQTIFPQGGNLMKVLYGASNKYINFRNLPQLTTAGVDISTCKTGITDFFVSDCPNLGAMSLLYTIYSSQSSQTEKALKRIRCTGMNETAPNAVVDMLYLMSQGGYNGLDAEGVGTTGLPIFEGNLHVAGAVRMIVEKLKTIYPQLTITYDTEIIPSGFTVNITSKTSFKENEVIQLTAQSSNNAYSEVEWMIYSYGSYSTSELSIDKETGLVTILGETTNTSFNKNFTVQVKSAYNNAIYVRTTVYVTGTKITALSISGNDVFNYGEDGQLTFTVTPAEHTKPMEFSVEVSKEGVISVDNQGTVVVLTEATELVTITATLKIDPTIKAVHQVLVNDGPIATSETNAELVRVAYLNAWCASENEILASEAMRVTNIGTIFKGNTLLESFEELKYFGVTTLVNEAFYQCTNLKSIDISNITSCGTYVFRECALTKLEVPETMTTIPTGFCSWCWSLKDLTLNRSYRLSSYYGYEFGECPIEKLTLGGTLVATSKDSLNLSNLKELYYKEGVTELMTNMSGIIEKISIPKSASLMPVSGTYFGNAKNVEFIIANGANYKYENGLLTSSDGTICYRGNLSEVSLPESIKKVASYGCSSLKVLSIPENLEYIGTAAFSLADLPEQINLSSLSEVGSAAFQSAKGIKSVKISLLGSQMFESSTIEEVELPESATDVPAYCFLKCSSLVNIIGLDSITSVGHKAFGGCSKLTLNSDWFNNLTSLSSESFSGDPYNSSTKGPSFEGNSLIITPEKCKVALFDRGGDIPIIEFQGAVKLSSDFMQESGVKKVILSSEMSGTFDVSDCVKLESIEGLDIVDPSKLGLSAYTFSNTGLKTLTIPEGFTTKLTIASNTSLEYLGLPSTLTHFPYLSGCTSLKTIICRMPTAVIYSEYSDCFGSGDYSYVGRNTYNTGENILYVPADATGYEEGQFLNPLCNPSKCGFTLSKTL